MSTLPPNHREAALPRTNPCTWLVSEADPEVAKWSRKKSSLRKLSSAKRKSSPSAGKTISTNHGWKSGGSREGRDLMTLASQSRRWSKLEQELSFQSTARRCSPRTGTDSGSGISTLSTSEYAQEMPSSLSAPVSDLDPPDVKDGQRR